MPAELIHYYAPVELIAPSSVTCERTSIDTTMLHGIQQKPDYYMSFKSDVPRLVPIAPAPEGKLTLDMETEKRRYTNKSNPYTGSQAASIARRNARERNRVKQVNDGFNALRKRLPSTVIAALSGGSRRGSGKKLSKVDTLKMVVEYIRYLQGMIEESDAALGVTRVSQDMQDEGVFGGRSSPYSDSVPSPSSECSSGVSSGYSNGYFPNYQGCNQQFNSMEEDNLLDAISWWQEK